MNSDSLSKKASTMLDLHLLLTEFSLFFRRKLLDHLDDEKISLNQFRVLRFLKENPGISLSSLKEIIIMKKGNLSRSVDAMVRQNLINRSRDESGDRRKIELSLTTKGEKILEELDQNQNELIKNLYNKIPEEEMKEFIVILNKLQGYLNEGEES